MKKTIVGVAVLLVAAAVWGRPKAAQHKVSITRLGSVLHCLQSKAPSFGYPPPRFDAKSYRVRYVYGKWSPVDENNELHMVVYGPQEELAVLFEVYFRKADGSQEIFIGDAATLKREKGRLVTDKIPGGQATLRRIERLLTVISHRRVITVPNNEVKEGPAACVYQP